MCACVRNPGQHQQLQIDVGAFGLEANLLERLVRVARLERGQFGLELFSCAWMASTVSSARPTSPC
jgi:hypothetical protein